MAHDLSARIEYSEKYVDDTHEYRYEKHLCMNAALPRIYMYSTVLQKWMWDSLYRSLTYCVVLCLTACALSRHVILPKEMQRSLPDRLLSETEWRQLGVQQSRGWVHYAIHKYVCVLVSNGDDCRLY